MKQNLFLLLSLLFVVCNAFAENHVFNKETNTVTYQHQIFYADTTNKATISLLPRSRDVFAIAISSEDETLTSDNFADFPETFYNEKTKQFAVNISRYGENPSRYVVFGYNQDLTIVNSLSSDFVFDAEYMKITGWAGEGEFGGYMLAKTNKNKKFNSIIFYLK